MEVQEETTKTTTTIRKSIIITAVIIGIIAAFSQLLTESNPKEISTARANNKCDRENRDYTRDEILTLLENHLVAKTIDKDVFDLKAAELLSVYKQKAAASNEAIKILNETKASYKFRGFDNVNTFLANFGVYLFGSIMALLLYLFSIHLMREKYSSTGKSLKFISQAMFAVFFTYFLWSVNPNNDLYRSTYIGALLLTSYFAFKGLAYLLKNNLFSLPYIQYDKLRNAVSRLFDILIIDVNDRFVKEDQKKEYIKFYGQEIKEINKIVE